MGYWKCKECGGKIRITIARSYNEDFNVDENGDSTGKCLKKYVGEIISLHYFCQKCGVYESDEDVKISDIAEWVKE